MMTPEDIAVFYRAQRRSPTLKQAAADSLLASESNERSAWRDAQLMFDIERVKIQAAQRVRSLQIHGRWK